MIRLRLPLRAVLMGTLALTGLVLVAVAQVPSNDQVTRKSTDAPIASRGKMVQELFLAIDRRDTKAVDALLKAGADPNSRNGLEFTPLHIAVASHQPEVAELLIKAGAKPDAISAYGTPLTFACETANIQDAKRLLALGAKPDYPRNDGATPLMMAAHAGMPDLVSELLTYKIDVDAQDDAGETALSNAARDGWVEATKRLLGAAARVDTVNEDGQTPLMEAAMNGHTDVVKLLIEKGSNVNAKDNKGRTAAILAASYGDNADVLKALSDAKADMAIKDSAGRTAADLVKSRGFAQSAAALGMSADAPVQPTRSVDDAINRSLKLIEENTKLFEEAANCVSCHHEGIGRMATGQARSKGFKVDPQVQQAQHARIAGMITALRPLHEGALKDPKVMMQLPLIEINEVTPMSTWLLAGMADQNTAPNAGTAAMAMCLARQQSPDGCWTFSLPRVPMQSSLFTFTALAAKALNAYGPKSEAAEIKDRLDKARKWFEVAKPQNSEDRASKLLGLKWTGADQAARQAAIADIVADQKSDGGWAQLPNGRSDAYATGQALYALRVGGMSTDDPVYQKGVRYLLLTQDDDGSWYAVKRAIPANNYFDAGFPHGVSQYSSFNATCWATLALLGEVKGKPAAR